MVKRGLKKNRIFIYPDWCKGCGICVAFCPTKVFELDAMGKARVVNESACVNCGFCELHCPDFAIVVSPGGAAKAPPAPSDKPAASTPSAPSAQPSPSVPSETTGGEST